MLENITIKMNLSDIISLFGFGLGAVNLYLWHKNNKRSLSVSASIASIIAGGTTSPELILISIANSGKGPITVNGVRMLSSNNDNYYIGPTNKFPLTLDESKSINEVIELDGFLKPGNFIKIKRILIIDSLGNKWPTPKSDIKKINDYISNERMLLGI